MSKLRFVDPATLSEPAPGLAHNYVDYWWLVDEQGRIAFFTHRGSSIYASPQCNSDARTAQQLAQGHIAQRENGDNSPFAWAVEARHFPLISVPARVKDYS